MAHPSPPSKQLTTKRQAAAEVWGKPNSVGLDMGIFFVEDIYISADEEMKEEFSVLRIS